MGAEVSVAARAKKSGKNQVSPRSLKDLQPDRANARLHPARNLAMIRAALEEVGAGRSIVIDEAGEILVGNGTVKAALAAGLTKLHIVDTGPDTLVAVRRRGLSAEAKTKLALFDNRAPELAEWNADAIARLTEQGWDLSPFFHADELKMLAVPVEAIAPPDAVDEAIVNQVKRVTCPKCGKKFPI